MTRKRWKNPDKRMAQAVELRQRGWSLRRIAEELAVGVGTIHRDLARYDEQGVATECPPSLRIVRPDVPKAFHGDVPLAADGTREWNIDGTAKGA